ncbi:hypothetical protein GCM10022251_67860 [Phytohabitans flavus]|uniref:DUF998 domain-containing protein n=1 Tax=Phytohabitans flavus TaxID=1076124 RepID=A0A6F8XQU1_9ACTN|nr:DUF998 domain-containing protein [Phytohabitans flavus]BCB76111.1 hypothetical protein Pflav_025210 [Phytohabitans flavus]
MSTRSLLWCGVLAGPVFLGSWLVQALTRDGYDPARHPISLLSLGDLGWVQIATFVASGALLLACAAGLRRVLRPGRAGTWGPVLVAVNGIGLILAGVFVTDAGAGFPPGAPEGAPERISWHGALHEVGFAATAASWLAVCFVLRRRFVAEGRRRWAVACLLAPLAYLIVAAWPHLDSLSLRLVAGSAISFGFLAAVALQRAAALSAESGTAQSDTSGTALSAQSGGHRPTSQAGR